MTSGWGRALRANPSEAPSNSPLSARNERGGAGGGGPRPRFPSSAPLLILSAHPTSTSRIRPMNLDPIVLEGRHVRLVPMTREHVPALWRAGSDPGLWRLTMAQVASEDDMRRYVEAALAAQANGTALPFVTTDAATGEVIGSTRFGSVEAAHRRVEIGWTWISPPRQRTAVNTEAKYLMLRHAFETLGCVRVELKTDVLNARSRAAILRIGAREEGVLRKHQISESGRVRDTVYFSVIDDEWPGAKARLEDMLAEPRNAISHPERGVAPDPRTR